MIKIKNVSKEYVTNSKVVKNLNLEIRPGEIFGFLGPNGAGKTTTLAALLNLIRDENKKIIKFTDFIFYSIWFSILFIKSVLFC